MLAECSRRVPLGRQDHGAEVNFPDESAGVFVLRGRHPGYESQCSFFGPGQACRRPPLAIVVAGVPKGFRPSSVDHPRQCPLGVVATPLSERGGRAADFPIRQLPSDVVDLDPARARFLEIGFSPLQAIVTARRFCNEMASFMLLATWVADRTFVTPDAPPKARLPTGRGAILASATKPLRLNRVAAICVAAANGLLVAEAPS